MSEKQKNMRQTSGESITADQEGAGAQESESQCMGGEETIGSSESTYLALAQNLPGIVYRLFPWKGSRMVFFNDAVREMTGFAPEELHHGEVCSIDALIVPEDRPQIVETVKQAMINKQPFGIEYRLTHRDGTIRYFLERGKPVLSEQGDISHIDGVIFDITSRKQVEELLRQSRNQLELQVEERTRELAEAYEELKQLIINREQLVEDVKREREVLQKIIDNIPVMLCFYDSSGEIRMINREFVHRLGWSVEQLRQLEDPMAEFYPDPEYRKEVWDYMMEASRGWRDFRVTTAHGGELESSWANVRLSDNSQIGIGIDVTESKVAEKELLAYQDRLRSLSSELSLTEERERRKFAEDLHDSVAQLLVLAKFNLEDVLAKSSLEAGRTEIEEVCQYLDEAMEQTRSMMYELSPPELYTLGLKDSLRGLVGRMRSTHNVQVDLSADEIPEGALNEDTSVLLYRSVQELLMNIVKHAGVSRAKLSLFKNGDAIRVEVEDEGIGCDLPSIKEYSKLDKGGRFGLLSIKERLSHLGGQFEISSQPGKGTLVTLAVPLPKETVVATAEHVTPIRVLIADDHQMMREGLRSLLESQNFEIVAEAKDGEEAVRLARETTPDVVIMDIAMPVMDGIGATRRIVAELPEVRVIGLSANRDKFKISQALESGARGFVLKGSAFQELNQAIHTVVNDKSIFLSDAVRDFFPDSGRKSSSS